MHHRSNVNNTEQWAICDLYFRVSDWQLYYWTVIV